MTTTDAQRVAQRTRESRVLPAPWEGARPWAERYQRVVVVADSVAVALATLVAVGVRFGIGATDRVRGIPYADIAFAGPLLWLLALALGRAYEDRFLGTGSEEYKRVANVSFVLIAGTSTICFLWRIELSRYFFGLLVATGTTLLLVGRYAARKWLHRQRSEGRMMSRTLVVGSPHQVEDIARQATRAPHAGHLVVGACMPSPGRRQSIAGVPVLGSMTTVADVVRDHGIQAVAVAASPGLTAQALRTLSWELEGTGVDLLVSPSLTDVAGPRIHIRPVAGMALLHVEEPELSGGRQLLKTVVERIGAALALIVLAPVLLGLALAVRLTSPGPAIFRQARVGKDGRAFELLKFRSMYRDAERMLVTLSTLNEHDGLLFKIRRDPRVTTVGRFLRKWSLDELPQLVNVLKGDMALVGPRPPLPNEVAQYGYDVRRRLLVKPGMTGLWQVSGRADLSWEDSVRLDLYYVENWSLAMDLSILWKTLFAVARGRGAY